MASGLPLCPRCSSPAQPEARYCAACGTNLERSGTEELRKLVSVLFCDLVGSTALGERLDPETFRQVQLRYFTTCEAILARHGGTIEKFIGDAVQCVFGVPVAREDDALRACRAALALVVGIEELNTELERDWELRLAVRIGVNSGVVLSGKTHAPPFVSGDAVNTAARLEQVAGAGEVLIGAVTRNLVGDAATCTPVRPLALKGKGDHVPAWRLIAVDAGGRQAGPSFAALPMLGRDAELAAVSAWLNGSERSPTGLCVVVGSPGIGKSRLVAAAAGNVSGLVLVGRCAPHGEGAAYGPLGEWTDALGDSVLDDSLGPAQLEAIRFAAGSGDTPATAAEIQAAACALARSVAAELPLVLVLEDAQWAEPAMLELATAVGHEPNVRPLVCARPDGIGAGTVLGSGAGDLRIDLQPLDPAAAAAVLDLVSPELGVDERKRLLEVAEGNPLVIGQLARHIEDGGDPRALPATLDSLLQARIESLAPEERGVAERAAVMGREFWDSGIAALAPDAPPPGAAIALLMGRGIVAPGRADGAREAISPTLSRVFTASAQPFSFTSSLLRDALYQAIPKLRRADLHERLAELLERAGAADEPVAFHLEQAAQLRAELRPQEAQQLAVRAAERLERAGERAFQRHDGGAARALLTRAAALVGEGSAIRKRLETSRVFEGPTAVEFVPGDVVGSYRIRTVAGRGGMGVVYRADDLALRRHVALKVIAPQFARNVSFRERFARESRIAAHLEHPNVVPVYGAGEQEGCLYIAMRFVEGVDLQMLLRGGRLEPRRAALIVAQVAEALDAAHARGLVHRDVKPANVLLTTVGKTEQAYLTDFGLARDAPAGDALTKTGEWVGTVAYVAPEQIRGEPVDARADIYALGAVLYQCLTGSAPFPVESELETLAAHLERPAPQPSETGVPRAFDAVVTRAMSKDASKRFKSAGDLGRAALAAAEGRKAQLDEKTVATGAAGPVADGRGTRQRSRTRLFALGAAAVAVLVAVALGAVFVGGALSRGTGAATNPAGRVVGKPIPIPEDPDFMAAGGGQVWALAARGNGTSTGNEIVRLTVANWKIDQFAAGLDLGGLGIAGLSLGRGGLWIARTLATIGGVDHIDPVTGETLQHVPVLRASGVDATAEQVWVVAAGGSARKPGTLIEVDSKTDRASGAPIPAGRNPTSVITSAGSVWVANKADGSVWRFDPRTRRVVAKVPVGGKPELLAESGGRVWVADLDANSLLRIDTATNRVAGGAVILGKELTDMVGSQDSIWVSAADGTVTRLDPVSGAVVGTPLTPARAPLTLAADGRAVWVGSVADRTLTKIEEGG